jgi:glycosyltransferase involved in cell wall biosynthesis
VTQEVSIVQELLPQYRVPFFEGLRENLAADDIRLRLLHGSSGPGTKGDERALPWAEHLRTREIRLPRGRSVLWQSAHRATRSSDLVVIEHAARHLSIWPMLVGAAGGRRPRMGFWGHGTDVRTHRRDTVSEAVKQWASRRAHWWFAYTEGSADRVAAHGFPRERITVVNNTVEVHALDDRPEHDPKTCVYVGGLFDLKRIPFLLEVGTRLGERVPGFRLVVLGGGPDSGLVEEAARTAPWLDFRGPTFDDEKALALASSSLTLMPGVVGLAIVDTFAYGCPIVTTDHPFHSPEIEYLRDGVNGVMLPRDTTPAQYADAVAGLLQAPERLARLREAGTESAQELTMARMVQRFADGIRLALAAPTRTRRKGAGDWRIPQSWGATRH